MSTGVVGAGQLALLSIPRSARLLLQDCAGAEAAALAETQRDDELEEGGLHSRSTFLRLAATSLALALALARAKASFLRLAAGPLRDSSSSSMARRPSSRDSSMAARGVTAAAFGAARLLLLSSCSRRAAFVANAAARLAAIVALRGSVEGKEGLGSPSAAPRP